MGSKPSLTLCCLQLVSAASMWPNNLLSQVLFHLNSIVCHYWILKISLSMSPQSRVGLVSSLTCFHLSSHVSTQQPSQRPRWREAVSWVPVHPWPSMSSCYSGTQQQHRWKQSCSQVGPKDLYIFNRKAVWSPETELVHKGWMKYHSPHGNTTDYELKNYLKQHL